MQYSIEEFGLFQNNKNLQDLIQKNGVKEVLFQPPHIFLRQENDSIVYIKEDGNIIQLTQTTSKTKFILFHSDSNLLIRCDSERKLTFNMIRNDQMYSTQNKIPITNVLFTEKDTVFGLHHPKENILFISSQGSKILYKIRYNLIINNDVSNENNTFKVSVDEIEEVQLKSPIVEMKQLGDLILFLIEKHKDNSTYCIYDMKLELLQYIPYHQSNKSITLLKHENDMVIIELTTGKISVMNSTFTLPYPIKFMNKIKIPKSEEYQLMLMKDILVTLTNTKMEYYSLKEEKVIYETEISIENFNIERCILFENELFYGIYEKDLKKFYIIKPKTNFFMQSTNYKRMIEMVDIKITSELTTINNMSSELLENKINNQPDSSSFVLFPRRKELIEKCTKMLLEEKPSFCFDTMSIVKFIEEFIESMKENIQPQMKEIPHEKYISFDPIEISEECYSDLKKERFELFGYCVRKQFISNPRSLLFFIQELRKKNFSTALSKKIISSLFITIHCVDHFENFGEEQLHVTAMIQFILYGIDNVLKEIESKQGIFALYSINYERWLRIIHIICDNNIFGYDEEWKRKTYEKLLIHLLRNNNEQYIMEFLETYKNKIELVENVLTYVILNKMDSINIEFLMNILKNN